MQFIQTPLGLMEIEEAIIPTSNLKFSRLFGYTSNADPIAKEQKIIAEVIEAIASSTESVKSTIDFLVSDLGGRGLRNRSGKRWTKSSVLGLIRPIYGGMVKTPQGFVQSIHYPPIVPWKTVQTALRKVRNLNFEANCGV